MSPSSGIDKTDTSGDPIGISLNKRGKNKDGKVLPDAVREVGAKPKVD